jgi:hypothetical protein
MGYSILNGAFRSHLTQVEYRFTDRDTKRVAYSKMLEADQQVRDAAHARAREAGVKKMPSDKEIGRGEFIPSRSTVAEKIAEESLARGAKHDVFAVAAETVRLKMRSTDHPDVQEENRATLARLEIRSAELAQQRAAAPPPPDPNSAADKASALREAAQAVANGFAGTPDERAQNKRRAAALLKQADVEDATAAADAERAVKVAANAPWLVDADATLFRVSIDPTLPQTLVNDLRTMRDKLANLEATKDDWLTFVDTVETTMKASKAARVAALNQDIANLEAQKTAIRNPPADPPEPPPAEPPVT